MTLDFLYRVMFITHNVCNTHYSYILIVGSRFSDRVHYNEFVESGAKSWALMRRRLVLGMKGTQNRVAQRPREKGPLARGRECANPSRSRRSLSPVSGPPPPLGGLCCYLFLSSVHPHLTLVSHPCLSSSAYPINHSFWRSVSCCGPHRPIQGSHPHQRGLGC